LLIGSALSLLDLVLKKGNQPLSAGWGIGAGCDRRDPGVGVGTRSSSLNAWSVRACRDITVSIAAANAGAPPSRRTSSSQATLSPERVQPVNRLDAALVGHLDVDRVCLQAALLFAICSQRPRKGRYCELLVSAGETAVTIEQKQPRDSPSVPPTLRAMMRVTLMQPAVVLVSALLLAVPLGAPFADPAVAAAGTGGGSGSKTPAVKQCDSAGRAGELQDVTSLVRKHCHTGTPAVKPTQARDASPRARTSQRALTPAGRPRPPRLPGSRGRRRPWCFAHLRADIWAPLVADPLIGAHARGPLRRGATRRWPGYWNMGRPARCPRPIPNRPHPNQQSANTAGANPPDWSSHKPGTVVRGSFTCTGKSRASVMAGPRGHPIPCGRGSGRLFLPVLWPPGVLPVSPDCWTANVS
jgi:hypothetical protein